MDHGEHAHGIELGNGSQKSAVAAEFDQTLRWQFERLAQDFEDPRFDVQPRSPSFRQRRPRAAKRSL